jgi:hypothetical protein
MDVQEWVDDLRGACHRGFEVSRIGSDVWTRDLSHEEEEILVAAANGSAIRVLIRNGCEFPTISTRDSEIFEDAGLYARSLQWYALRSLAERGVLKHVRDGAFILDQVARLRGARLRAVRLTANE